MTITPMPGSWAAERLERIASFGSAIKTFTAGGYGPRSASDHTVHVFQNGDTIFWACADCSDQGTGYTNVTEAVRAAADDHEDYYDMSPSELDDWGDD